MNPQQSPAPPFAWPVRVYYEDTDSAGVVYYANYLRFLERARTEWLRSMGFDQTDLVDQHNVVFVVASLSIDYHKPAVFNDELQVTVELASVGAGHIQLAQQVLGKSAVLATAQVKVACVSVPAMKPVRMPKPLLAKIRTTT